MTRRTAMDPAFLPASDNTDALPLFAPRPERADTLALHAAHAPVYGGYESERDLLRLKGKAGAVLALLLDGHWHTLAELRAIGGASGDRRGRELRQLGFGFDVERDPNAPHNSGIFRYRLTNITAERVRHALSHFGIRDSASPHHHGEAP